MNDINALNTYCIEDLNGDAVVNIYDLSIVFDNTNLGISVVNP